MSLSAIPVPGSFANTSDSSCSVPVEAAQMQGQHPHSELTYDPSIDLNVSLNVSLNSICSTAYTNSTTASSKKINKKHYNYMDTTNEILHSSCHLGNKCAHRLLMDSASDGASLETCSVAIETDESDSVFNSEDCKQPQHEINIDSHKAKKDHADGHRETCRLLMRGRGCVDRTSSLPKLDGTRSECTEGEFSRTSSVRLPKGRDNSRVFRPSDLTTGELLGRGSFGQAFKVTHRLTGEVFVLKELYRVDEGAKKAFLKEVALLRSVAHPNVLQFCGVVYREGRLHLITEFIGGGSLQATIRDSTPETLPYRRRVAFARDIAAGMDYLHGRGIIHRDLNSHNCLVRENDSVVVADFGLARILREPNWSVERKKFAKSTVGAVGPPTRGSSPATNWKKQGRKKRYTVVGNPYWMAPEMITGSKYDEKVDIFSFGIILCELISRIDADPDVMPRLNNFGLNVFEFRAQFCHECPEAFWRLAFLCCSLDPDRRPPFGDSRRWLDGLVLDTVRNVVPSEALLLELEGYGDGDRSDNSSPDCGGSSEASTPDTAPSSRPLSSGQPLMRTISETLPPRSPRHEDSCSKGTYQRDSKVSLPHAKDLRDRERPSRQEDKHSDEPPGKETGPPPTVSVDAAVANTCFRGGLEHVNESISSVTGTSVEGLVECEPKDWTPSSPGALVSEGSSSGVVCCCATIGERESVYCRKCCDSTTSWSTNQSQNIGSDCERSNISNLELGNGQSINTSLSVTEEGINTSDCWHRSPIKARPGLTKCKCTTVNASPPFDAIEGVADQSHPPEMHARRNCICSTDGAAPCGQCLCDVSCGEERSVGETTLCNTSHLNSESSTIFCNKMLRLVSERSSTNDKESPAKVSSSTEVFIDFIPPRHIDLSSIASSSDVSTVILNNDYRCPNSSSRISCTDVAINSMDAHSSSYSKYKPVYELYSASKLNSTHTASLVTPISTETKANNSLPVKFSCLSTDDVEGAVLSNTDSSKPLCSSQASNQVGSSAGSACRTPFMKSSSEDSGSSSSSNYSKNGNQKRPLLSNFGGGRSKQSPEGRSRSRALRASRTLTQSNLWGLVRFTNGHMAASGGENSSTDVPGSGSEATVSIDKNAAATTAHCIVYDASLGDGRSSCGSCRSLPLISPEQQPENLLTAKCRQFASSSSGAIDTVSVEATTLGNGQTLHRSSPNNSDMHFKPRTTATHCRAEVQSKRDCEACDQTQYRSSAPDSGEGNIEAKVGTPSEVDAPTAESKSNNTRASSVRGSSNGTRPTIAATTTGRWLRRNIARMFRCC